MKNRSSWSSEFFEPESLKSSLSLLCEYLRTKVRKIFVTHDSCQCALIHLKVPIFTARFLPNYPLRAFTTWIPSSGKPVSHRISFATLGLPIAAVVFCFMFSRAYKPFGIVNSRAVGFWRTNLIKQSTDNCFALWKIHIKLGYDMCYSVCTAYIREWQSNDNF